MNVPVRKNIEKLIPYSSARTEYTGSNAICLDANENPFNQPFNRYPDPLQKALKERLGQLKAVPPDHIFVGNGSDEAIDLLFRIFCEPGEHNAVSISPTYGMYQVCADINGVQLRTALLNADFSLNYDRILSTCNSNTRLLFICSPNNPTSNSFDPPLILQLAQKLNLMVVVDEAYIDFSERESLADEIRNVPNLIILQTLSKAWGVAGIRLGMALANPEVIGYMNKVKYPYNINSLTMQFALETLNRETEKNRWVEMILAERKRMEKKLKVFRMVQMVHPSDANFLLVQFKKARQVYQFLVERKIIVRDRSKTELCEDTLRITIGSREENDHLIAALMDYQRDKVESCEL